MFPRADLRLRVEHISTNALADCHAHIDIQPNPGYPHPWVALILACEKGVVMMV